MKKLIQIVFFALIALNTNRVVADKPDSSGTPVAVVVSPSEKDKNNKLTDEEAKYLVNRLKEIRDLDKKNMTVAQKHELRKEVKAIRAELRQYRGVTIYLSGAVIIIILLLIILL